MFALDKPVGPTSVQALTALRDEDPSLSRAKLGHAGRLDPLAEGLLVVLVDDENRQARELRRADKTYEVDVIFGVDTDSFDALGLVRAARAVSVDDGAVRARCASMVGTFAQRVAPFAQVKVHGRSLISYGHAGIDVERPTMERTLYAVTVTGWREVDGGEVEDDARRRVARVRGDFRQDLIDARWREAMRGQAGARYAVASLEVSCSSGTYMRSLAHDLGASVGVDAIAWRIRRTRAGAMTLDGARALRGWDGARRSEVSGAA